MVAQKRYQNNVWTIAGVTQIHNTADKHVTNVDSSLKICWIPRIWQWLEPQVSVHIHVNHLIWLHMFTVQNDVQTYAMTWDHVSWGQTLPLFCRKRIAFLMSTLLFSALNICTVMTYFMCLKVVDAGQQQLSLLATAYKILKWHVLASAGCGGPEEGNVN